MAGKSCPTNNLISLECAGGVIWEVKMGIPCHEFATQDHTSHAVVENVRAGNIVGEPRICCTALKYRADIDGLRAAALLSVIAYSSAAEVSCESS